MLLITNEPDELFRAYKIDVNGNHIWGEQGISVTNDVKGWRTVLSELVLDGNGGIFITWSNCVEEHFGKAYIQRIDTNGVRMWNENGICLKPE